MTRSKALQDTWDKAAANPGQPIPIGATVVCDVCDEDFTDSPLCGGFIFGSYAYCPGCASRHLPDIVSVHETRLIRARCPEGVSFADFVRGYRGPDAAISVGPLQVRS